MAHGLIDPGWVTRAATRILRTMTRKRTSRIKQRKPSRRRDTKREVENRLDALAALALMRREGLSATRTDKVDVSRQMISRYETGHDVPVIDVLVTLAKLLETDFRLLGHRIDCEPISHHRTAHVIPKQLELEFEKPRRFPGATIEITPRKGRILISADIPA